MGLLGSNEYILGGDPAFRFQDGLEEGDCFVSSQKKVRLTQDVTFVET
jgi:hypothetical protein